MTFWGLGLSVLTRGTRILLSSFRPLIVAPLLPLLMAGLVSAQTVTTVTNFSGQGASSGPQYGALAQGRDGTLYGTTYGASGSYGAIFRLVTTSARLAFPHLFDSASGGQPLGGVMLATDGNYYGVTTYGGSANDGVLYRIAAGGTYTVLHEFLGGSDGANPLSAPVEGDDGNLYGLSTGSPTPSATLYQYTQSGSFNTLYTFDQAHGGFPISLIQATDGNLYGVGDNAGANGCGTLFKFNTSGSLLWSYSFPCGTGGANPTQILQATDGNFYGPTLNGGGPLNYGTIFKLDQAGNVSLLYTFPSQLSHGGAPLGLMQASDGNLYGVAGGGQANDGVLFKLTISGTYTKLYSFTGKNGNSPESAPLQHTNGLLYGTTQLGGKSNAGTVYSLNVGLAPFVTFVRSSGKAGQSAQILGQGFTGTTSVTFNGAQATSIKVVSDTFMTAVVPSGATTGPVVVTTPGGPLTSNRSFTVSQ